MALSVMSKAAILLGSLVVMVLLLRTASIPEVHLPVALGQSRLLTCSLHENVKIVWSRNGEAYNYTTSLIPGQGTAYLEMATIGLNGSVFECFAISGDETRSDALKRWIITVEAPPTLCPNVMVAENGSYAINFNLSESSEADNTTIHVEIRETNFTATVNGTRAIYCLPASVCSSVPTCVNCSATFYANNAFGTGELVEVTLRSDPDAGCGARVEGNSSYAEMVGNVSSSDATVVTDAEGIDTDDFTTKVVLGVVISVIVFVVICMITLVVCCALYRRRRLHLQNIIDSSSQGTIPSDPLPDSSVTTPKIDCDKNDDGQTEIDHPKGAHYFLHKRSNRMTSTTRNSNDGVVELQLDPSSMLGAVQGFQEEADTCIVQVDEPPMASTPTHTPTHPPGYMSTPDPGCLSDTSDLCDSGLPLLETNTSHDAAPQYGRQESLQDENGSPCHVFHKVSSGTSLFQLEGSAVAVGSVSMDIAHVESS